MGGGAGGGADELHVRILEAPGRTDEGPEFPAPGALGTMRPSIRHEEGSACFMPHVSPEALISQIHAADARCGMAITGGGSRLIGELLSVPGGSRSVIEACVPYSAEALTAYLGARPEQFCSTRTARAMAMTACQRARRLEPEANGVVGLGVTASLASDRPKRGSHRVHVALQTAARSVTHSLEMAKGTRDRLGEESLAARVALNLLAEGCGLADRLPLVLHPGERVRSEACDALPAWQALLAGEVTSVLHHQGEAASVAPSTGAAVFPGAFNPLHAGHRRMAEFAARLLGRPVEFEISIFNVDKPPLDFFELRERAAQFGAEERLWFTSAPRFVDKARRMPGATFLIGIDTLERIGDPAYYDGSTQQRDEAIAKIAGLGTRFLVFGRLAGEEFRTLNDLTELPDGLRAICQGVSQDEFREDISSSALREAEREEG